MTEHRFIDYLDASYGEHCRNEMWCTCGVELLPDCDISRVSINECWAEHLASVGVVGYTV